MGWLLTLIFSVSGAAALVYEVAWVRMLANNLGASSYTIGTVLAAFMGGLALGARLIGKRADKDSRPLVTYAKLEAGVAVCAVFVPFAFGLLPWATRLFYPALETHLYALTAVRSTLAFLVLIVPTALMGATFPAIASAISLGSARRGWRIGMLYGANTLGAVAGVLLAGFFLIGHFGLRNTTWIAAAANLLAAGAAWWIAGGAKERTLIPEIPTGEDAEEAPRSEQQLALVAAAAAGFVSLGYEVLWTRMFSVLFASVTYSFSLMLAMFLLGIGLGAPAFGKLADHKRTRLEFAGVLQLLVAVAGLTAFLIFPLLTTTTGTTSLAFGGPKWGAYLWSLGWDAAKIMLVPALLMGGVLPIATRVLAQGPSGTMASRLGRVYAANTVGAMLGSLVTGFILIPAIGNFARVSIVLASLSAISGAVMLFRGGRWLPLNRWLVTGVAAAAIGLLVSQPEYGRRILMDKGIMKGLNRISIWYEEGPSLTVAVVDDIKTKDRTMYTDAFEVAGTGDTYEYMRMIAHLPMLLHPESKSACCVGLGTGTTAGALSLWPLEHLDIVELCPEVARGTAYFGTANRNLMEKIGKDPRLRLVFDDGKAYLRCTRNTYDVIVAEPLNPHMTGAASLYSRDFYEAARGRLNPGGIVTQWIPLHGVKTEDFRALFHTFTEVFPQAAAWYFREAILLTGVNGDFGIHWVPLKLALDRPQIQAELIPISLEDPYTLLASFVCGPRGLANYARYAEIITDDLPTIEYFKPGRPLAFAERANLDGLTQNREQLAEYVDFKGLDPRIAKAQAGYFKIASTNHFTARGEYIAARLLQIDSEGMRAAGDMRAAGQLTSQARERLESASRIAPGDKYVQKAIEWYTKKLGEGPQLKELTPEIAKRISEMSRGSVEQKLAACQLLGKYADWQSGAILENLISDDDDSVRMEAVRALAPIGRDEVLHRRARESIRSAELLRDAVLRERESEEFRRQCVDSLKSMGPAAASYLIPVFPTTRQAGVSSVEVRRDAVAALREMGTDEAIGYLILVIHDPDSRVRGEAVVSLANSRVPDAVPGLMEALKDTVPAIREAAAEGLKRLTRAGASWSESASPEVREAAQKEWDQWFDGLMESRKFAQLVADMPFTDLEVMIQTEAARLDQRTVDAWTAARAQYVDFRDPAKTKEPKAALLDNPVITEWFRLASGSDRLWLAALALERRSAAVRGIDGPARKPVR